VCPCVSNWWIWRVLGLGRLIRCMVVLQDPGGRKSLITTSWPGLWSSVRTIIIYVQMRLGPQAPSRRSSHYAQAHSSLPLSTGSPFDVSSSRAGYGAHVRVCLNGLSGEKAAAGSVSRPLLPSFRLIAIWHMMAPLISLNCFASPGKKRSSCVISWLGVPYSLSRSSRHE
jgi:hypothetical protein